MLKRLVLICALLSAIVPLPPAETATCTGINVQVAPFAFEQITVATVAIGGTAVTYNSASGKAVYAVFSVETASLRYRSDGTDPTSTVGHLAQPGQAIEVCSFAAVSQLKMIRTGGTSADVFVTYYKAD